MYKGLQVQLEQKQHWSSVYWYNKQNMEYNESKAIILTNAHMILHLHTIFIIINQISMENSKDHKILHILSLSLKVIHLM